MPEEIEDLRAQIVVMREALTVIEHNLNQFVQWYAPDSYRLRKSLEAARDALAQQSKIGEVEHGESGQLE